MPCWIGTSGCFSRSCLNGVMTSYRLCYTFSMRGGEQKQGYTIVEVMVFLAISGFMFLIAAGFVAGRQSTAEFKQGMNSINDQMRQVINDVGNGFYPSNSDFTCNAVLPGQPPFTVTAVQQR